MKTKNILPFYSVEVWQHFVYFGWKNPAICPTKETGQNEKKIVYNIFLKQENG